MLGAIAGGILGIIGWLFKYLPKWKYMIYVKATYCVAVAIGIIIFTGSYKWSSNAKYIACLVFGYACYRVWGEERPNKEIA